MISHYFAESLTYWEHLMFAKYQSPWALGLLFPCIVLSLLQIWRQRRLLPSLLRLIALALLIFALANPVHEETSASQKFFALLDVSASMPESASAGYLEFLQKFLNDTALTVQDGAQGEVNSTVEIIPFAQKLGTAVSFSTAASIAPLRQEIAAASANIEKGETNIASALRQLFARSSPGSVFLLSDGYETSAKAQDAVRLASTASTAIFPIVLDDSAFTAERLDISSLYAPITSGAGDKAELRLAVRNPFKEKRRAEVQLWLDQEKLFDSTITFAPGKEELIIQNTKALEGGLHRLRAVLIPQQGQTPDSAGDSPQIRERHRWISVKEKAKILLLHGGREDQRVINELIRHRGYGVEDLLADGSREIPTNFSGYAAVIINNVARDQLPASFLPALEDFATAGGGVLLIGGNRSFGLGKYIETPLEKISPLKFLPPQTIKKRLPVAVALVIDKSGSMGEQNKLAAAKQAAIMSMNSLRDEDFLSVIGFDAAPFVVIDLKPVAEVRELAERRLRSLTAAGQTNLLPALAAARQRMMRVEAGRKHLIILSDGRFPLSSDVYVDEINQLKRQGITVSAIALGYEADVPFMKFLAAQGKGSFYHTLDPSNLPQVFVEDIKVSTGEKTLIDEVLAVGVGPGGLASTTIDRYPPLRGFVETLPKVGSTLELITRRGDKVFPILASWAYGKGRVIAFTSDANGRWSEPWTHWPGLVKFWTELIEKSKSENSEFGTSVDFDLRYSVNREVLRLELSIFDSKLTTQAAPSISAQLLDPGGEPSQLIFRSEKKGRFFVEIPKARPGDYQLNVRYGALALPPLALTLPAELFGEVPGKGINRNALEEMARLSGGMINPRADQVASLVAKNERQTLLFVPLLFLAFVCLLLEVFLRELGLARFGHRRGKSLRRSPPSSLKPVGDYGPSQNQLAKLTITTT